MAVNNSAVIAWGSGEDGQLGLGDNEEKEWVSPITSLASLPVRSVVAGSRNSLAVCDDGKLFMWGWNQRGTLGHTPSTKTENIPSQVKDLDNVKIVQAAIGGWHCLAVDDQGRAYAWGGNEYGQCGEEPEKKDDSGRTLRRDISTPQRCASKLSVRQVAAGGTHSVVLTREGHVWTWGQPWPPGDIKQISTPVRVQGLEKVAVGDVIYIEANSGAVKRVGRTDPFATEFDLEAEEYVPLPKGEVHKKKEIVQMLA